MKKRKCVILVGVSGSGKDTLINQQYKDGVVVSADNIFLDQNRVYTFRPENLGEGHNECFREFLHASFVRETLLVVNNTNTTMFEIGKYLATAEAHGYNIEIVRLSCDPKVAHERNVHGTPEHTVLAQHKRIETLMPELEAIKDRMRKGWSIRTVTTGPIG